MMTRGKQTHSSKKGPESSQVLFFEQMMLIAKPDGAPERLDPIEHVMSGDADLRGIYQGAKRSREEG